MAPAPLFVVLRVWCHLHTKHFEVEAVERVGALGLSSPVSLEFFYVGKKSGRPLKILPLIPSHSRHLLNVVIKSLKLNILSMYRVALLILFCNYITGVHLISKCIILTWIIMEKTRIIICNLIHGQLLLNV